MVAYILRISYPLNALCLLPYDYQFLMHFMPTLDDSHSKFSQDGGGGGGGRVL